MALDDYELTPNGAGGFSIQKKAGGCGATLFILLIGGTILGTSALNWFNLATHDMLSQDIVQENVEAAVQYSQSGKFLGVKNRLNDNIYYIDVEIKYRTMDRTIDSHTVRGNVVLQPTGDSYKPIAEISDYAWELSAANLESIKDILSVNVIECSTEPIDLPVSGDGYLDLINPDLIFSEINTDSPKATVRLTAPYDISGASLQLFYTKPPYAALYYATGSELGVYVRKGETISVTADRLSLGLSSFPDIPHRMTPTINPDAFGVKYKFHKYEEQE